jgi:hypothetical protein
MDGVDGQVGAVAYTESGSFRLRIDKLFHHAGGGRLPGDARVIHNQLIGNSCARISVGVLQLNAKEGGHADAAETMTLVEYEVESFIPALLQINPVPGDENRLVSMDLVANIFLACILPDGVRV